MLNRRWTECWSCHDMGADGRKIKVVIIGCGNIGTELAYYLIKEKHFQLAALVDCDARNFFSLSKKLHRNFPLTTIAESIEKADLIIEAANKDVVKEIFGSPKLDKKGKHLLVMSTGGLIENSRLLKKIKHCQIHIPSGAIAGLDAVKAASGKIEFLSLTTTKAASSLMHAPFVVKNKITLDEISSSRKIFEGNIKDAIRGFPQNINVAASLFLASTFRRIKISIIADPHTKYNTHEIICRGSFGEINTVTKNLPSRNPKTSYMAILSPIAVLKNINANISIGN
ncbi:MAG: DUF108 domain-containing protein [Bacteroidia bacterium]|nr:DUF108 domain-containing protein [Bacteroidia bacterium]